MPDLNDVVTRKDIVTKLGFHTMKSQNQRLVNLCTVERAMTSTEIYLNINYILWRNSIAFNIRTKRDIIRRNTLLNPYLRNQVYNAYTFKLLQ